MAKQVTKTAVPRLRFPEFRGADGWKPTPLGKSGTFIRGLTYGAGDVQDDGLLVIRSTNIQDGNLVLDKDLVFVGKKFLPEQTLQAGDVAICMSNGSKALVGKSAEYSGNYAGSITVGAFCSIFRPSIPFAKLAFKSDSYADYVALAIGGGNINNLKNSDLECFVFAIPISSSEQQKIADCMASLDEVIAAQGRKVEALKAHKRGLMQQLFPREGETRPRLRFPEFRDAPEWMQQRIEAFARDGLTNGIFNDTKRQSSSYRLINVSEMYLPNPICESDLAFAHAGDEDIKKKFAHNGDIFFTRSSLVREGIAYSNIYLGVEKRVTFDGHLIRLRPKLDVVVPIFLHYALKSDVVRSQFIAKSKSATMTTIGQRDVGETGLAIPQLEEQQRIADCLTSLDTQITAETQQLIALKIHKQGLMQQLFPAPEAAGA